MKANKTLRTVASLQEACQNIADNTIRFCWSHDEMLRYYRKYIREEASFRGLPRWAKSEIYGFWKAMEKMVWRNVVYSYVVNEKGDRFKITDEEYHKVSPYVIHSRYSQTGCYVWRDHPTKFFTYPNKTVEND